MYYLVIVIALLSILNIYLLKLYLFKEKEINKEKENQAKRKQELDLEIQKWREDAFKQAQLDIQQWAQSQRESAIAELHLIQEQNNQLRSAAEVALHKQLHDYEESEREKIELGLREECRLKAGEAYEKLDELLVYYDELGNNAAAEYARLKQFIDEWKSKQDAINNDIMRRREIEEQEDYYRVILNENAISDISLLNSIRGQLIQRDSFDKLIYDCYIAKPVNEMIKRILKGEEPCGIYKITRLKTGEIYIGQSANIKNRWQQHCKTVFHCGTISHSTLHTTMQKDGIQNFTFEVVEIVPKDQLNNREKYWIDFYDSKKFGLNEKL